MDTAFLVSYLLLSFLLLCESFTVSRILKSTIGLIKRRSSQHNGPTTGSRIASFRAVAVKTGADVTATDLLGKSTALLFVNASARQNSNVGALAGKVLSMIEGRLFVSCYGDGHDCIDLTDQWWAANPRMVLLADTETPLADLFHIREFPTALIVDEKGFVKEIGTILPQDLLLGRFDSQEGAT